MYTPEDSPFEKFRTEKLKGVAMSPDALELVAKAYEVGFIDGMQKQMQSSVDRAVNRMAEQPAQQALDKMAENAQELGIQMQPAQQEPVAWTLLLVGKNQGLVGKAGEKFVGNPEHYERVDVFKSPQPSKPWVELTDDDIDDIYQGAGKNDLKRAREVLAAFKEKNT